MGASHDRRAKFGGAILVALLSVVTASGCAAGNGGSTSAAATPTATPAATADAGAPTPTSVAAQTTAPQGGGGDNKPTHRTANTAYFQIPGGKVGCHVQPTSVRCDVQDATFQPPAKPASCQDGWGTSMYFDKGKKGKFICSGDSLLPAPEVLPFGSTITVNRIKCVSEAPGFAICYDLDSGHGVALSQKEYRFPEPS
jgi:hypothetical protein